jgi:mannose-1-phosphate guanylyltransferase
MLHPIKICILCGGSGSRLYPLSTKDIPKQFISLGEKGTLLEETLRRVDLITTLYQEKGYQVVEPLLIMHKNHKLPNELKKYENYILYEDYANDTAVAILRLVLSTLHQNTNLLILPADHYIHHVDQFVQDIVNGTTLLTLDNIVLYGITPNSPDTKYGYIIPTSNGVTFKEKPSLDVAIQLLNQNAVWNAGIFLANNQLLYQLLSNSSYNLMDWINHPRQGKTVSFDVAVLQQFNHIKLYYSSEWGWNDIGSWNTFCEVPEIKKDLYQYISDQCENVKIINRTKLNIITIGCQNLFVIGHGDNLLIMSNEQDYHNHLKNIVQQYNL